LDAERDAIFVITRGKAWIRVFEHEEHIELNQRDSLFVKGPGGPIENVGDEDLEFVVIYAAKNDKKAVPYRQYKRGEDAHITKSPFVHDEAGCDPDKSGKDQYSGVWNYTFEEEDKSPAVLGVMFNPGCQVNTHYHPSGAIYINTNGTFTIHNDGGDGEESNSIDAGEIRWVGQNFQYGPEVSTNSKMQTDLVVVGNSIPPVFPHNFTACPDLGEVESCMMPPSSQMV